MLHRRVQKEGKRVMQVLEQRWNWCSWNLAKTCRKSFWQTERTNANGWTQSIEHRGTGCRWAMPPPHWSVITDWPRRRGGRNATATACSGSRSLSSHVGRACGRSSRGRPTGPVLLDERDGRRHCPQLLLSSGPAEATKPASVPLRLDQQHQTPVRPAYKHTPTTYSLLLSTPLRSSQVAVSFGHWQSSIL
jgi:hypothetical protein